ncbi:hypothetical protein LX92_04473, partial [Maribacter polysiphoniae]
VVINYRSGRVVFFQGLRKKGGVLFRAGRTRPLEGSGASIIALQRGELALS